ncbi:MAG: phosphate signaling complex protein PhoU [Bradyrhizobium sp.]|nr:phosphate signaling complex protein PhoU [Pseudomonadota bacterium]MDE2469587.1 phosphate signaling complex protein PhoU [Bradyrhizobium sp.]
MVEHTMRAFDSDLQELAKRILDMGQSDLQQIDDAIEALLKRDTVLARRVVESDDLIDTQQRDIEENAIATIARRQPMAVDLREIAGALRISNDLERTGDLAENIAKRVLLLTSEFCIDEVMLQLQRMAQLARVQLEQVLHSYQHRDVAVALEVWRKDREIDALDNSLFRELLTYMMENPRSITFCAHMLFCAKNIERIGDHATNIAETVYYIVEGHPVPEERPKADLTSKERMRETL